MEEYRLGSDEVVLVEPFEVSLKDKKNNGFVNGKLMLTNKYIVWAQNSEKKPFRAEKNFPIIKYNVKDIKIYNGIPQVKILNEHGPINQYSLIIYLKNDTLSFIYIDIFENVNMTNNQKIVNDLNNVQKFVNEINMLLTGNSVSFKEQPVNPHFLKGSEKVAYKVGNAMNIFKRTLDGPQSKVHENTYKQIITANCLGCGSQLTGIKGNFVICQYCGRRQQL